MNHSQRITLIESFLKHSSPCVTALRDAVAGKKYRHREELSLYIFQKAKRQDVKLDGNVFLLRTSTEYSNPQLNLEDLQGILTARLMESCVNYMLEKETMIIEPSELGFVAERLEEPMKGAVVPFLLVTDDVEPDRYSINPLRESLLSSGQSAFPVANVRLEGLEVSKSFLEKYHGALICHKDVELIEYCLHNAGLKSYVDFVDATKYDQLSTLSETLGINLIMPSLRMPLETLRNESIGNRLHRMIEIAHSTYENIRQLYSLMGRNILKHKTLLPAVPHSPRGYGSKRCVKGQLVFENGALKELHVKYRDSPLYRNEIDKDDVSIAKADGDFTVPAQVIQHYDFRKTPASPQFALYTILSPEDACLWHGVGKYAGSKIVQSYTATQAAYSRGDLFQEIMLLHGDIPIQFDLIADKMLTHPMFHNIDASVNCVDDIERLLPNAVYTRVLPMREIIP